MVDMFYEYMHFYKKYATTWWNHVGPFEYLTILISVGVVGYLLMLRTSKRNA